MDKEVEIWCSEERRVIGQLDVGALGSKPLTAAAFCLAMRPERDEYRVDTATLRNGEAARCPLCHGLLTIPRAALVTRISDVESAAMARALAQVRRSYADRPLPTRDEARVLAEQAHGGDGVVVRRFSRVTDAMPIILGTTRIATTEVET